MAATGAESGIRVEDGGISLGRSFGARRLKVLLELSRHSELDDPAFQGQVLLHFGQGRSVKVAIHPVPREISE